MTKGTVKVESLRKEFDEVVAVKGINLEIESGEFFTILGPSGCGKTTTLRMIAGLETPTSGDIYISGKQVTSIPANKRDTSIVFQKWALFPHMSVGENVAFGLEMDGVPKAERAERVSEVLELVELSGYEDRNASQLSGGQKQRVAMARSIVQEPDVLLLDEPLASLDRALRERLQVELKNIQEELGITFIHVTHDQEEALSMSDRIAVINEGEIEQVGGTSELYDHPKTRFVASFLGETNLFEGRVARSNGQLTVGEGLSATFDAEIADVDIADGDDIAYTIRPEKLQLSRTELALDNTWRGVVENAIYKGSNTIYEIDVDGHLLKAFQPHEQDADEFEEGESVIVGFESDDGEVVLQ